MAASGDTNEFDFGVEEDFRVGASAQAIIDVKVESDVLGFFDAVSLLSASGHGDETVLGGSIPDRDLIAAETG